VSRGRPSFALRLGTSRLSETLPSQPSPGTAAEVASSIMPLMTVDEVAAVLKLSPRQVRRHVAHGALQSVRLGGRVRFEVEAVSAFIRRGRG